jgi:hypothetical protein
VTDAAVVAYYGDGKPPDLVDLVTTLQGTLREPLGECFIPRALNTVHTTVIGLDSAAPGSRHDVRALLDDGDTDLAGFAAALTAVLAEHPVLLQYGGFEPDRPGLRSRGLTLHERGLGRSGDDVVLVGWPLDHAGEPCLSLHELRRTAAGFGFAHRYPLTDDAPDPDSHLVIGTLGAGLDERTVDEAIGRGREHLRQHPCRVGLRARDLAVVTYTERDLPPGTTTAVPVGELEGRANGRPGAAPTAP